MRLRTLVRRIIIAVGWGALWLYALFARQEQDWRSMFALACFVLFAKSFMWIGDDE